MSDFIASYQRKYADTGQIKSVQIPRPTFIQSVKQVLLTAQITLSSQQRHQFSSGIKRKLRSTVQSLPFARTRLFGKIQFNNIQECLKPTVTDKMLTKWTENRANRKGTSDQWNSISGKYRIDRKHVLETRVNPPGELSQQGLKALSGMHGLRLFDRWVIQGFDVRQYWKDHFRASQLSLFSIQWLNPYCFLLHP